MTFQHTLTTYHRKKWNDSSGCIGSSGGSGDRNDNGSSSGGSGSTKGVTNGGVCTKRRKRRRLRIRLCWLRTILFGCVGCGGGGGCL